MMAFNSFPVAALSIGERVAEDGALLLSILSQLLLVIVTQGLPDDEVVPFNSFPVAARNPDQLLNEVLEEQLSILSQLLLPS